MRKSLYWAAGALVAGMTFAGAASAGPVSSSQGVLAALNGPAGVTQELSARCRTVWDRRWRNGRRITVRRTVCDHRAWRPHCRTVVTHRWHHGNRVTVRKRVC